MRGSSSMIRDVHAMSWAGRKAGQRQHRTGAVGVAVELELSAMSARQRARDRQPQASCRRAVPASQRTAEMAVEHLRQFMHRNADALVADGHPQLGRLGLDEDVDRSPARE